MNEYQEAFETVQCKTGTSVDTCLANKQRNMKLCIGCDAKKSLSSIRELVDRGTPKKPLIVTQLDEFGDEFGGFEIREWDEDSCPICYRFVGVTDKFCRHCGQAIDWSEEDDGKELMDIDCNDDAFKSIKGDGKAKIE